jgi:hypothetical protein
MVSELYDTAELMDKPSIQFMCLCKVRIKSYSEEFYLPGYNAV